MAQITLNSTGVASSGALVLQSNGTTTAVTVSTGQVATLVNDAVVNGLTVGRGAGAVATNTAVGASALQANSTGASGVAIGNGALYSNTTASFNTAVGYQAGYSNVTGQQHAFFGRSAGRDTTGNNNTFIGDSAGIVVTSGSKNTILGGYSGNQGGLDIRTASNYVVLSDGDGNPRIYNEGTYTNFGYGTVNQGGSIRLQDTAANNYGPVILGRTGAIGATTDQWVMGSNSAVKGGTTYNTFTVTAGGSNGVNLTSGATAWTSASDERLKDIIEPITDAANKVSQLRAVIGKYKTDADGTRRPFLIAQDLQAVLPEAVSEGRNSKGDETEYLQVAYTEVIPLLVAAIKELKAEIDALKGA